MKAACRVHAGTNVSTSLLIFFLIFILTTSAYSAEETVDISVPDAVILLNANIPEMTGVSITYSKVRDKADVEADLAQLLQHTGWTAAEIKISTDSLSSSGENPMTAVDFITGPITDQYSGVINIEPIVTALKNLGNIKIIYLMPSTYTFSGVEDFENKYVKITLKRGTGTYQYDVQIKDPQFSTLDLPIGSIQKQPVSQDQPRRNNFLVTILIILLAITLAVLTYTVTDRIIRKSGRQPGQRS